jgi:hypothetical protein
MRTLTNTDGFPGILSALTLAGVLTSCAWLLVSL